MTPKEREILQEQMERAALLEIEDNNLVAGAPEVLDVLNRRVVFILLSRGYRLRIPRDGSAASMVDVVHKRRPAYKVSFDLADDLTAELEIIGEGRSGDKAGWKELGLDGSAADFYRARE